MKSTTILNTLIFLFSSLVLHAQTYELILHNGIGSGTFSADTNVHIFARTPLKKNQVFIRWEGDGIEYLKCPQEWHTTLNVPEGAGISKIKLNAVYGILSPNVKISYDSLLLWGERNRDPSTRFRMKKPVYTILPAEKPKGCVFVYHGTGGSAHSFFIKYDLISVIKDLAFNNYAVFVLSSNETDLGDQNGNEDIQWVNSPPNSTTKNNIDLLNVDECRKMMINKYKLQGIPFFSFGVSNGGNFGDLSSAALGFKATAHMVAHGSPFLFKNHPDIKPHIWLQAHNDNHPKADSNIAKMNHHTLLDRGIPSEWHWLDKSPLYPTRFTRSIHGIDEALSKKIYQTIKSLNWLDENDFLTYDAISLDSFDVLFSKIHLTSKQRNDVKEQFKIANAEHGGHGEYNKKIISFFDRFLSPVLVSDNVKSSAVSIHIFPSPCTDFLKIYSDNELKSIQIFDIKSKVIYQGPYYEQIDVSSLSKGYYFIKIETDKAIITKRFIKS